MAKNCHITIFEMLRLRIASEFTEPTVVAVKHMNPCGIGTENDFGAYRQAFEADPVSILVALLF